MRGLEILHGSRDISLGFRDLQAVSFALELSDRCPFQNQLTFLVMNAPLDFRVGLDDVLDPASNLKTDFFGFPGTDGP